MSDSLAHFGVKGQKWGQRKTDAAKQEARAAKDEAYRDKHYDKRTSVEKAGQHRRARRNGNIARAVALGAFLTVRYGHVPVNAFMTYAENKYAVKFSAGRKATSTVMQAIGNTPVVTLTKSAAGTWGL